MPSPILTLLCLVWFVLLVAALVLSGMAWYHEEWLKGSFFALVAIYARSAVRGSRSELQPVLGSLV